MGMSVGGGGKNKVRADLNVTPMIDVLLVLLIIFMVLTPLMMMDHRVEIPKRAEVDLPPDIATDQTVLTYTKDGQLFINQARIERSELAKELINRFEKRREKTVFLNIDPEANYGESLRIIDIVKSSGIDKLAVPSPKDGEKFELPGAGPEETP